MEMIRIESFKINYRQKESFFCLNYLSVVQERHLIIFDSWNIVLVQCRLSMPNKYIYEKNAQLAATVAFVDI